MKCCSVNSVIIPILYLQDTLKLSWSNQTRGTHLCCVYDILLFIQVLILKKHVYRKVKLEFGPLLQTATGVKILVDQFVILTFIECINMYVHNLAVGNNNCSRELTNSSLKRNQIFFSFLISNKLWLEINIFS